jgi:hypothetical protein
MSFLFLFFNMLWRYRLQLLSYFFPEMRPASQSWQPQYIVPRASTGSAQAAHKRTHLERCCDGPAARVSGLVDHFLISGAAPGFGPAGSRRTSFKSHAQGQCASASILRTTHVHRLCALAVRIGPNGEQHLARHDSAAAHRSSAGVKVPR